MAIRKLHLNQERLYDALDGIDGYNQLNPFGFKVAKDHFTGLVDDAKHARLIKESCAERTAHLPLQRRIIAWIGCRMVEWGSRLQAQAGNTPRIAIR